MEHCIYSGHRLQITTLTPAQLPDLSHHQCSVLQTFLPSPCRATNPGGPPRPRPTCPRRPSSRLTLTGGPVLTSQIINVVLTSRAAQQTQHGAAQSHTTALGPPLLPARTRHLHQKSSCAWAIKSCPHNEYVEQYCHANLYNMLQIGFSIYIPMFSCLLS